METKSYKMKLKDLLGYVGVNNIYSIFTGANVSLIDILDEVFSANDRDSLMAIKENVKVLKLDNDYIIPKFSKSEVIVSFSIDYEKEAIKYQFLHPDLKERFINDIEAWALDLMRLYYSTYAKYIPVLEAYEASLTAITSPYLTDTTTTTEASSGESSEENNTATSEVKTISKTNDTPQQAGDYTADMFTSAVTQVQSLPASIDVQASKTDSTQRTKTDISQRAKDNLLQSIIDLREKWYNVFEEWADKFSILFY